ncbi:hypothetical protein [Collimonas sp. OK412]|uniref:hypothetical protein n=1 Tax=Collimonas sp. (strain OK412) TaxID=1801619 RepID=UPI000B8936F6|nr:hypothetical protein [Collimonas sp. OK412]
MNASIVTQTRDKEYEMPLFALPDPQDLADIIADRLDLLCNDSLSAETRAQVIDNCIAPVTLMIQAGEMMCAAGDLEQMVFVNLIGTLVAQAETSKWLN